MATTVPGLRRTSAPKRGLAAHRMKVGDEHGMEPGMLGLTLFVASEVMFFAALFGAYFTFKADAPQWPPGDIEPLKVPYAAGLTVLLVSSSLVLQMALITIRRNMVRLTAALIGLTFLMGVVFLGLQAYEWHELEFNIKHPGAYASLFYTITGFHGLHVAGGVVALAFALWRTSGGHQTAEQHTMLEGVSFYWHFVDVVWVGVFTTLYLVS